MNLDNFELDDAALKAAERSASRNWQKMRSKLSLMKMTARVVKSS